jgi:uncharacterized membrane-anchored protein
MVDKNAGRPAQSRMGPAWLDGPIAWLKSRERLVLLAAAGFHVVVLVMMIALSARPLVFGDTILVRVAPVDPRDLFRGEYVILSYEFNRIPSQGIEGLSQDFNHTNPREWQGRTVYVSLAPEPDGVHWRADKVSIDPPPSGKYIRGRITGYGRIEYGIEAFYLQEGTGHEYEQAIRDRTLSAEIAVTSDGQAALRGLRIE